MENKSQNTLSTVFTAIIAIAFIVGLIVFEYGLYSYFSRDGSPWLIMFVMNAIYMVVAFIIIGGLNNLGRFGMPLGYLISIAGLFLFGISTYQL